MVNHAKKAVETQTVDAVTKLAKSSQNEKNSIDFAKLQHKKEIERLKLERSKLDASLKTISAK